MTIYTTDIVNTYNFPTPPGGGVVAVREAIYDFTAAFVTGDIIQMIPVNKGERVLSFQLFFETALDSGSGLLVDVGDTVQTARYVSASTMGRLGGVEASRTGITTAAKAALFNYVYPAKSTVDVLINTQAATGAPTTGRLRMRAEILRP